MDGIIRCRDAASTGGGRSRRLAGVCFAVAGHRDWWRVSGFLRGRAVRLLLIGWCTDSIGPPECAF